MNLKYWITGFIAIATTAYILNTFNISKINNGFEIRGSKNVVQLTSDSNKKEIKSTYNNNSGSIESIFGLENNNYYGSFNRPSDSASFNYNTKSLEGSIDGFMDNKFIGSVKLKKDSSKSSVLDSLIAGFDYLYNKNGVTRGVSYIRF